MKHLTRLFLIISFFGYDLAQAQKMDKDQIRELMSKFREDSRGPYRDIKWFCKDGSVIPPKEVCPEPGGFQRARYKDEVLSLAKSNHIFLGQILSTTPNADFWDKDYRQSRIKQYQLEKYLRVVDNGWILEKAQFYRGAIQIEDEQEWGLQFFLWLLADKETTAKNFFLIRQAVRDLPHEGDNLRSQDIRSQSKVISDAYAPFTDLRIKIHGQPEVSDIQKVKAFKQQYLSKLSATQQKQIDQLVLDMEKFYQEHDLKSLSKYLKGFAATNPLKIAFTELADEYNDKKIDAKKLMAMADLMWDIRKTIFEINSPKLRLALLDLSIGLEEMIYREVNEWHPENLRMLLLKTKYLAKATAACGFLEVWEWDNTTVPFVKIDDQSLTVSQLSSLHEQAIRWTEWGAGMVRGTYEEVVTSFEAFEPQARGFIDERVRGSVLLPLGNSVSQLGEFISRQSGLSNQVMNIADQSQIRGLNPGYAMGELVVVSGNPDEVEVSKDKIYIFNRPSSDLKPVAGIATVSEGNAVSHVQLLARNLAIPNAVFSYQNLEDLKRFSGQKIFYAVSNKGTVIMKAAEKMTAAEKKLFEVTQRKEERIRVPIDKIDLSQTKVLNLRNVNAASSGKLCGPKAANLGQLKALFPGQVVEGLVVPFGIFRTHLDQRMTGGYFSYWQFINNTFIEARKMQDNGCSEEDMDVFVLTELGKLREAIKTIKFKEEFVSDLKASFAQTFGQPIGKVPVFLRSDTNMEDLKDFTGAGLNLTLFNVLEVDKILQGIKEVWASPYTERSYKWRQRYLLNPENVFPSILIIPTVDVDHSGVLITKGISNGSEQDLTIAFSRGAGGAVDGQAAESYLLHTSSGVNELLSPAREPYYRRLPATGGSSTVAATFEKPILSEKNLTEIRKFSGQIRSLLPNSPGIETSGPFDIEFGFKDDVLWLFQVRPFVENKSAKASLYLESITPELMEDKSVLINSAI